MKPIKKTIYTLNIGNYCPEITALTYPYISKYADKIGADFHIIRERKFPDMPITYEKFQLFKLAREMKNDWSIFVDSDTLIHPDLMDITVHLPKDTVAHNGNDQSSHRYKADEYFLRDGRFIGSCNWFAVASDLCLDLWHPLEDLSLQEALGNIFPTGRESNGLITRDHLIDDYVCSRNIARYGLKFTTVMKMLQGMGYQVPFFLFHQYNISEKEKLTAMRQVLTQWGITKEAGNVRTEIRGNYDQDGGAGLCGPAPEL